MNPSPLTALDDPRMAELGGQDQAPAPTAQIDPSNPEQATVTEIQPIRDPSNEVPPIDGTDGDLGELALDLWHEFQEYKEMRETCEIENEWRQSEQIYLSLPYFPIPYGGSNYMLREVFRQVRVKIARFNARFMDDRMFEFKARHYGQETAAEVAAHHIRWQLNNYGNAEELRVWGEQKFIFGTSQIRFGWANYKHTPVKMTRLNQRDASGKFIPVWKRDVDEITQGAPYVKYVDHKRIYSDIECDKIQDSPFVWEEMEVSDEYIWTQVRLGFFDRQQVESVLGEEGIKRDLQHPETTWRGNTINGQRRKKQNQRIVVMGWTNGGRSYVYIEGGKEQPHTVVQATKNVYGQSPHFALRNAAKPGYYYGEGEPNILMPQDRMLKELTNMATDAMRYEYNPAFVCKDQNVAKQFSRMKMLSGEYIDGFGAADLTQVVQPLNLNGGKTQQLIGMMLDFVIPQMESTTGVTKEVSGSGPAHRTASGIQMLQKAAEAILDEDVKKAIPTFKSFYETMYNMNRRWLQEDIAIRVEGPDGRSIVDGMFTPEVFSPQVDVEVLLADNMESPEMRQQKAIALWQALSTSPTFGMWNAKPIQLYVARCFEPNRAQAWIADPSKTQQDALDENTNFLKLGDVWEVSPHDNHAMHLQIHQMAVQMKMQSPDYLLVQDPKEQQKMLQPMVEHLQQHQFYLAQQQPQGQGGSPAGLPQLGGVQNPQGNMGQAMGNDIGNAMNNNAQIGAQQQGMMPHA